MCENCEQHLDNYKQSLKNKNNLFAVNQRVSFQNSNDYGEGHAPRNMRSGSADSEEESPSVRFKGLRFW